VLLSLAAAGCGGSAMTAHVRPASGPQRHCGGSKIAAKREAQRKRLNADLVRLRAAAATVKGYTQNGNDTLNAAVDRFAVDVASETLSVHERSAYINHAAATVSPKCYLCFQALEANRPTGAAAKLPCD
jgi:hypothetical protein